jgi:hypothetical protein
VAGRDPELSAKRTGGEAVTMHKLFSFLNPLEVHAESGDETRVVRKGESVWAETPLDELGMVVYVDNLRFWTHRAEFNAATQVR